MAAEIQRWRPLSEATTIVISSPEEYTGGPHLSVACTQTALKPKAQQQLVAQWCECLPTLTQVRHLSFTTRVPLVLFAAACQMPQLERLYIK